MEQTTGPSPDFDAEQLGTFDQERMKAALAGPTFTMPDGLTREQRRDFILASAKSAGPLPEPKPRKTARYCLERLLSGFDPERHGGEAMAWPPVGKEFPGAE